MSEKINIDCEMLPSVNKLEAISQLFDCASRSGQTEILDAGGFIGVSGLLRSVAREIMDISHELNDRIVGLEPDTGVQKHDGKP